MLDTLPQEDVRKSLLNYGVSEAVDYLINQVEAINSTVSTARHEVIISYVADSYAMKFVVIIAVAIYQ